MVIMILGLMNDNDEIEYFYEDSPSIPAFSVRSFTIRS